MVTPLAKAATPGRAILEAPNILKFKGQAVVCLPSDCVVKICCRSATAASRRLAENKHTTAECHLTYVLLSIYVENTIVADVCRFTQSACQIALVHTQATALHVHRFSTHSWWTLANW